MQRSILIDFKNKPKAGDYLRILIAEDAIAFNNIISKMLINYNYEVAVRMMEKAVLEWP